MFDRLRAAIDDLAAADAADLLTEARIEARARIRSTLTDALAQSMLEHLDGQLPDRAPAPEARPAPAREARPAPARRTRSAPVSPRKTRSAPASPRETQSAPAPRAASSAWYVYGVVAAGAELGAPPPGVDPAHPVMILTEGALAAVASQVPLEEFDETRLREHLADMAWVEATARAHEAMLDHVQEQTTVVPMRMCTVYRTEGGVREVLSREANSFHEAIEHLAGKAEWGVKAFSDIARIGGAAGAVDAGDADARGVAYMERKRTERELREQAMGLAEEAATHIHDRLSALAADASVTPLQRPEATGHDGDMILNGVYLVAHDAAPVFHDEVRALQVEFEPAGIELVPTGPWPAYNFIPGTIGAAW